MKTITKDLLAKKLKKRKDYRDCLLLIKPLINAKTVDLLDTKVDSVYDYEKMKSLNDATEATLLNKELDFEAIIIKILMKLK